MRIPTSLQKIHGKSAKAWVQRQNHTTENILYQHPEFHQIEHRLLSTFNASNRTYDISYDGDDFTFYQKTTDHPHGRKLRIDQSAYLQYAPTTETLIDMDALCAQENKEWVFNQFIEEEFNGKTVCLVSLSEGGCDSCVLREYNLATRQFIDNGFYIEDAHSDAIWLSTDSLLIATNVGQDTLTTSGQPAIVRILKRGQSLSEATTLFAVNRSSIGIELSEIGSYQFLEEKTDFYCSHLYLIQQSDTTIQFDLLPIPKDAELVDIFNDSALIRLRSTWIVSENKTFPGNSIMSIDIEKFEAHPRTLAKNLKPKLCFYGGDDIAIESVKSNNTHIFIEILNNLNSEIVILTHKNNRFVRDHKAPVFPSMGHVKVVSISLNNDTAILHYQNYLTPCEQYLYHVKTHELTCIRRNAPRFNAHNYEVTLHKAVSRDGTKIPYYMIASKTLMRDGCNPTLLYGYGGFSDSITPHYLNTTGLLLEEGFVYVEACIRGGGELGPNWHSAGSSVNKQTSFDDFIAVAESLIAEKITSPKFLGIQGSSNGGLLVAACAIEVPSYFGAVVCEVPLLDMLHYHQFCVGPIWYAEYGNPEDPIMRAIIKKYSPLQNIRRDRKS